MKNRVFVNNRFVFSTFLCLGIVALLLLTCGLIFKAGLSYFIFVVTALIIVLAIEFSLYKNLFIWVRIDEKGISNKYLFVSWEMIDSFGDYKLYDISFAGRRVNKRDIYPSMIGIGKCCNGSYQKQDPRHVVMFSIEKKTFSLLKDYGTESNTINTVLENFSGSIKNKHRGF